MESQGPSPASSRSKAQDKASTSSTWECLQACRRDKEGFCSLKAKTHFFHLGSMF